MPFPTGTGGAIVPATLANYGSTLFDSSTMNGANPGFTSSEELSMVQGTAQVSTPSAPNCQTDSFRPWPAWRHHTERTTLL